MLTMPTPSLSDLQQLVRTLDLRLELLREDSDERPAVMARRAEVLNQIAQRGGNQERLPYGEDG